MMQPGFAVSLGSAGGKRNISAWRGKSRGAFLVKWVKWRGQNVRENGRKGAIKNACGVRKCAQKYTKRAETCDFFQLFASFCRFLQVFFDFFIFREGVYADLIARVEGGKVRYVFGLRRFGCPFGVGNFQSFR